jgi:hypothetical protein
MPCTNYKQIKKIKLRKMRKMKKEQKKKFVVPFNGFEFVKETIGKPVKKK